MSERQRCVKKFANKVVVGRHQRKGDRKRMMRMKSKKMMTKDTDEEASSKADNMYSKSQSPEKREE